MQFLSCGNWMLLIDFHIVVKYERAASLSVEARLLAVVGQVGSLHVELGGRGAAFAGAAGYVEAVQAGVGHAHSVDGVYLDVVGDAVACDAAGPDAELGCCLRYWKRRCRFIMPFA